MKKRIRGFIMMLLMASNFINIGCTVPVTGPVALNAVIAFAHEKSQPDCILETKEPVIVKSVVIVTLTFNI